MDNIISSNSKVIFLDIDGVLNDEGVCFESGIYIDEFRVERLAKIVSKSGACIILTSAWRGAYRRYLASGEADPKVQMLQTYLEQNRLGISGYTDYIGSGPFSRPAEIRSWLSRNRQVVSYVILDDDIFWEWGELEKQLVLTRRLIQHNGRRTIKRGLEEEHVVMSLEKLYGRYSCEN